MTPLAAFPVQRILFEGERLRAEELTRGVVRLALSRPELRNAFDELMIGELSRGLEELAVLPPKALRLLLLEGEGEVFCAGADLGFMQSLSMASMAQNLDDARSLGRMFHQLAAFPAPVVCAVQGAAIGGGLGLAACADFVVAESRAVFATTEVRLGIVPGVISPYIIRKLGVGNAGSLMLTGRRIKGEEAQAIGLVQSLVPSGDSFEEGLAKVLDEFLQAGPEAARRTKLLLLEAAPLPHGELFEFTARAIAEARVSPEGQAGLKAFLEKTPAPWRGDRS
jgi:methylglutaconyl-CoA hydratase